MLSVFSWIPRGPIEDRSPLGQVMAWCCQVAAQNITFPIPKLLQLQTIEGEEPDK